jgi:pimeloyl-ACP methyl ester carboxylesterase
MKFLSPLRRGAAVIALVGLCLIATHIGPAATLAFDPPVSSQTERVTIFLPLIIRGFADRDFIELGAPADLAVVGEPYTGTVKVISYDPARWAVTDFRLVGAGAPGSTAPTISAGGVVTWTPTLADVGVHRLTLTAVMSDSLTLDKAITIEVAPRTRLIAAAVGNEGGVLELAGGDYRITLPPDAVADGADEINVELSVVKRADGSVQLTREFTGLKPGVTPTLALPLYAVTTPAAATRRALTAPAACGGLDFIKAFNPDPDKWHGGLLWKFSAPGKSDYIISQNVSNVRLIGRANLTPYQARPGAGMTELRGACQDQATCLGKQPVLFVHGYNPLGQLSGGVETWGCAFDYVKGLGGVPFEFSWRPNMRFEDAAYYLAQAIAHVSQLTGRKPLLVAHSMGGLITTTYLGGLAEMPDATGQAYQAVGYDSAAARGGRRSAAVAGLITVSSPLSGIATAEEGALYGLPQGRDVHVTAKTIALCIDFTCGESGLSTTQLTYPGIGTTADTTTDYEQVLGFGLAAPGALIHKLYNAWSTDQMAKDIHYDMLVSTWYVPGTPGWQDADYGDGLIAVTGMQALPTHFVSPDGVAEPYNYIRTMGRALTAQEKTRAGIPANLDYTFMMTVTSSAGDYGYPHGGMFTNFAWYWWQPFRGLWRSSNPNAPAAIFPHGGRLDYYGAFDHALKPVLDRAYTRAAAQPSIFTDLQSVNLTVLGAVQRTGLSGGIAAPLPGAPILVAFFRNEAYVGEINSAADAAGAFVLDVGRVLDDHGVYSLDNLALVVRIGNDTTHHAITRRVGVGAVTSTTDLGVLELAPR